MSVAKIASRYAGKATESVSGSGMPEGDNRPQRPKARELPPIYYDAPKRAFWACNVRGEWVEYPATHIRLLLMRSGVDPRAKPGEVMTPIEEQFLRIRQEHDVQWAGALAGFNQGIYELFGIRLLVTSGPRLLQPERGEWETLKTFLGELLGDQTEYLYGWLKSGLRSLYAGRPFRPGQAMAIAGPAGCGKSLLQGLLTELFGGRAAKPYRYLCGDTPFNGELLQAEHLAIEDEAASTDLRTRRAFGSQLKNMIANESQSLHAKGRQALTVTPFWRISLTLNDEPENLMVLPPLDESLRDKIILLRAFCTNLPFDTDNLKQRAAFRSRLSAELPAFLAHLQGWRIPQRMVDKRYGVKAFQHPDLLADLESLQPEFRLLELVDTLDIWGCGGDAWQGTATELRRILEDRDKRGEVARLLHYNTACGTYLGRLKRHFPHRIEHRRGDGVGRVWVIRR